MFGNNCPTHDGTGVRYYIHVVDLALGHIKALAELTTNPGVVTYNLGTGKGYSVLEMVSAFKNQGKTSHIKLSDAVLAMSPYAMLMFLKLGMNWSG